MIDISHGLRLQGVTQKDERGDQCSRLRMRRPWRSPGIGGAVKEQSEKINQKTRRHVNQQVHGMKGPERELREMVIQGKTHDGQEAPGIEAGDFPKMTQVVDGPVVDDIGLLVVLKRHLKRIGINAQPDYG